MNDNDERNDPWLAIDNTIPGGRYFFTVTLLDRASGLLVERIDELCAAFRAVRAQRPFTIRCQGGIARSSEPAAWRCGLCIALARNQITLLTTDAGERAAIHQRANKSERGVWQRR